MKEHTKEQFLAARRLMDGEAQQRFLAEATKLLSETLDYKQMLRSLAEIAVPRLGDFCVFDILNVDGKIQRAAWAIADPEKQQFFDHILEFATPVDAAAHPVSLAISTGKTEIITEVSDEWLQRVATSEEHLQFMRDMKLHTIVIVPLIFRNKKLGALKFCLAQPNRKMNQQDIHLAEELSERVAIAVHNANLYEQAQKEIAERRLAEEALSKLQEQLRLSLQAGTVGIWHLDPQSGMVTTDEYLARIFGVDAEEAAKGLPMQVFIEALHPHDRPLVQQQIDKAMETDGNYEAEYRVVTDHKRPRWILARGKVKFNDRGEAYSFPGSLVDITEKKEAEAALDEERQRYQSIFNATMDGIIICNVAGKVVDANPAAYKMHGYEHGEFLKLHMRQFIHPGDHYKFENVLRSVGSGNKLTMTGMHVRRDLTKIEVEVMYSSFTLKRELHLLGVIRDVTGRNEAERQLRASEALRQSVLASSPDCVNILTPEGNIMYINRKGQELLEVDSFEQIRYASWINSWDGIYREKATEAVLAAKNQGMGQFIGYGPTFKGTPKWWDVKVTPIKGGDGKLVQLLSVARDITDYKQIQDALAHKEENLRLAMEATDLGTWDFRPGSGIFELSGRCSELLGLPAGVQAGYDTFIQCVHRDDRERIHLTLQQALGNRGSRRFSSEFRTSGLNEKKERWVRAKGEAFFNDNEEATRLIGTVQDITERKLLEQQKDDFLGVASHELKTPVTSLKGYVQILETELREKGESTYADQLKKVDIQIDKLVDLINDLLDVTKIESGKLLFSRERFDFDQLVNETLESMQYISKGHTLVRQGFAKSIVNGDRNRIGQVITNLVSNAIKYSPMADKVIVHVARENNDVTLSVQDFGSGIPPGLTDKVFDRFFRINSSNDWASGLGLGLYISSEIIKRHNGRIWAESVLDQGSVFHVSLPCEA